MTKIRLLILLSFSLLVQLSSLKGQTEQEVEYALSLLDGVSELLEAEAPGDSIFAQLILAKGQFYRYQLQERFWKEAIGPITSLYTSGYQQPSINLLKNIIREIETDLNPESKIQANLYYHLARASYFSYEFSAVLKYSEELQSKFIPVLEADELFLASILNLQGAALRQAGNANKAIPVFEKVLQIRKRYLGVEHDAVAGAYNNIGNAYLSMGLYDEALKNMELSYQIQKKLSGENPDRLFGIVNTNLGSLYDDKGEYRKAIKYYQSAREIFLYHDGENSESLADIYTNLGIVHKNLNAFEEALLYYQEALGGYEHQEKPDSIAIGNTYMNMAIVQLKLKKYESALQNCDMALQIFLTAPGENKMKVGDTYTNLGFIYQNQGLFIQAREHHKQALKIYQSNPDYNLDVANTYNNIAYTYYLSEELEDARWYTEQALQLYLDIYGERHPHVAVSYNLLARIHQRKKEWAKAIQATQMALKANHRDFDLTSPTAIPPTDGYLRYDYFYESLMLKAELLRSGTPNNMTTLLHAQQYYQAIDTLLLTLNNELYSKEDRINLARNTQAFAGAAIANSLDLAAKTKGRAFLEAAFYFSERSKSAVLRSMMVNDAAKDYGGIPDSVLALEESLQSSIWFYQQELSQQPDSARQELYQKQLFKVRQEHQAFVKELEEDYPQYHDLKYQDQIPGIEAIQRKLEDRTTLFSYFTADTTLYVFRLGKSDFSVYPVSINKQFYKKQVALRKSITLELDEVFLKEAHDLFTAVFPSEPAPKDHKLVLVPDGSLAKLPFEALLKERIDPSAQWSYQKLPYLLRDHEISYAQSVAMYYRALTQPENSSANNGLIAFAPVFNNPILENTGDFDTQDQTGRIRMKKNTILFDNQYLNPLPETEKEVNAIKKVFTDQNISAQVFLRSKATESALRRPALSSYKYIHIASHGFINEEFPDLSGLLCFPDTSQSTNGVFTAGEVYGLELNADLLVLSACETGLGKLAEGEGLLGLSWAFVYAGAKNLMVSLWQVDDSATADIMTDFYRLHLSNPNENYAASLRTAKLDMIGSGSFSAPYYWAPFVLIGR